MLPRVLELLETLRDPPDRRAPAEHTRWLGMATDEEVAALLDALSAAPPPGKGTPAAALVGGALAQLAHRALRPGEDRRRRILPEEQRDLVERLYRHLGTESETRHLLLVLLTASRRPEDLTVLTDLLVDDPPADGQHASLSLAPLFQQTDYDVSVVFPRLLEAIGHSQIAAAVLDLANFVTREELVPQHPAHDRTGPLAALLGSITERLGSLETLRAGDEQSGEQLARQVSDGVALAVSLCDTLGLCGDPSVVGKLYQALEISHRRLRTEAAAALVRLGEPSAEKSLVDLAAEPVARLRVLAYADELNLSDRIDPNFRTPQARAQAELVTWLAEPTQFGIPPQECELFHASHQYWPGFDEPVECFLFRYTYRLGGASFSNLGIAGPLSHTFRADLGNLPPADIYAAFAGWQAEHEEVFELDCDRLNELERLDAVRLQRRLHDAGYENIRPITLGYFFGDRALVASAQRSGVSGIAVADQESEWFFPTAGASRPLGPAEAYCIYKGRKLLRAFNPAEDEEQGEGE